MKKVILFILFLALFGFLVYQSDPHLLWQNLQQMRWTLLGCVLVWGIGYLLNAGSFGIILGIYGRPPRPTEVLRLTIAGYAINYVTPFGLLGGEPYRVWQLRKTMGTEAATSSVLLYAMMHVCSHFLFWLLGCLLALCYLPALNTPLTLVLLGIVVLCLLAIGLFSKAYRHGGVQALFNRLERWPGVGKPIGRWHATHYTQLGNIDAGIGLLLQQHRQRFWSALGLELLSRMVNVLEIVLILQALHTLVGSPLYASAYLVVAFSSLFANLLFFSPLQMGTREGGILLVLQQLLPAAGYTALLPVAVSISLATRLRELVWIGIGLLLTLGQHPQQK